MKTWGISKGWTAIDAGDGASPCAVSVKTAVAAGQRPQVTACGEGPLWTDAGEPESLRELLGRMDQRLPRLMLLGRSQYRLQVTPEPPVPPREMEASLRWSLNAADEGTIDEMNLAWFHIPTDELLPARPKQLYTVLAPRSVLDARLATWRLAGARAKVVDIRETALRNIAAALERPGEGLALVSADTQGVGIVLTHRGSLYLDRYIEQPVSELRAADPSAREKLHERIALQVLRSIDFIGRNYPFMPVSRVVVAPSPEPLGLQEYLAAQLPFAVQPLDLNQVFDMTQVPALAQSPALQARCLVALGSVLRSTRALQ